MRPLFYFCMLQQGILVERTRRCSRRIYVFWRVETNVVEEEPIHAQSRRRGIHLASYKERALLNSAIVRRAHVRVHRALPAPRRCHR
jgi:hypothetical protein